MIQNDTFCLWYIHIRDLVPMHIALFNYTDFPPPYASVLPFFGLPSSLLLSFSYKQTHVVFMFVCQCWGLNPEPSHWPTQPVLFIYLFFLREGLSKSLNYRRGSNLRSFCLGFQLALISVLQNLNLNAKESRDDHYNWLTIYEMNVSQMLKT